MFTLVLSILLSQIAQDGATPARELPKAELKRPTMIVGDVMVIESDEETAWVLLFLPKNPVDAKDALERSLVVEIDKITGEQTTVLDGPAQVAASTDTSISCTANDCKGQACSAIIGNTLCIWSFCCTNGYECTKPMPQCVELPT